MGLVQVKSESIEAIQATAAAILAQCQALLPAATPEVTPQVTPDVPPAASTECLHEKKQSAARMGAEHAWYCPDCHAQSEE